MWLNRGLFQDNGRCGYVLKPAAFLVKGSNPYVFETYQKSVTPLNITIGVWSCGRAAALTGAQVIGARHLRKPKGTIAPFVEISLLGLESDSQRNRTKTVPENGFNPVWNEGASRGRCRPRHRSAEYEFKVSFPDVALLQLVVYDEDMFGEPNPIAVAVLPFGVHDNSGLRTGLRRAALAACDSRRHPLGAAQEHLRRGPGAFNAAGQDQHQLRGRPAPGRAAASAPAHHPEGQRALATALRAFPRVKEGLPAAPRRFRSHCAGRAARAAR